MPRTQLPISNGFYVSDSQQLINQECTNWYPNIPQVEGALSNGNLFGCAGIAQIQTTQTVGVKSQINRGMHVKAGKPYFLNGETLTRIDKSIDGLGNIVFTNVNLGTIPGEGRVSMADNGKELMVLIPGGNAYIIDESSGSPFLLITAPGFTSSGAPQIVVFIDSYFVCSTDSKKFIRSESNQGLVWNALNFFSAESDPDDIAGLQVFNNKLFVLGSEVTEEFQNLGGVFQRTGFFIDKGLFAKFSTISTNNSFMWIGGGTNESPAIWALSGNQPQKISTTAIDSALQDFSELEIQQAFSYSYAQNGAYFVGFSLPTRTFEYNTITGKWNERKSQIINSKGLTETIRWRVNSLGTAYNLVLCGDSQDGRIGSIEVDTFTEYGSEIIRVFSTAPVTADGEAINISRIEAVMQRGVGDLTVDDPKLRMSVSKDGVAFNNELTRSIGKIGETKKRMVWNKLGRLSDVAVIKFVMSDPVKPVFIKLLMNARSSASGN